MKPATAYEFYKLGYLQSLYDIKEGGTTKIGNEIYDKFDVECVENILFGAKTLLEDFISNASSQELPGALEAAQELQTKVAELIVTVKKWNVVYPLDLHDALSRFENFLKNDLTHITHPEFIANDRLNELRALAPTSSFDLKKLIRLCEEINQTYVEKCYFATAMLTRALLDHVPPLFEKSSFEQVANNYAAGKEKSSFKAAMRHLEEVNRKVADIDLHSPISRKETLPVEQQVDCRTQLGLLLSEIVRTIPSVQKE